MRASYAPVCPARSVREVCPRRTTRTLAPMSISRRHLLAGAGALLALAACGDDSSSGSSGSSDSADAEPDPGTTGFTIAQRYPTNTFVPGMVRLPISLADKQ